MSVKTCIVFILTLLCGLDTGHSRTVKANPGSNRVYFGVYRVKGDRLLTHGSVDSETTRLPPAGIHFEIGGHLQQQHARILKEEANKFIGRHTVMVN